MKKNVIKASYFITGDSIVEEVLVSGYPDPSIRFAVCNYETKKVSYASDIILDNGAILQPLTGDIITKGVVLLPSQAEPYLSEAVLIKDIESFINCYLDLPHEFYLKLVSYYVLLTWVYDKLSVIPYLRAIGDYGSGKTRFAQVVGSICYKPFFLTGATSDAFIFRMIELVKGTMVINELERINSDLQAQITVILNNGYEKKMYIGRVEGDRTKVPTTFDAFSPKIITSRGKSKDLALESRILSIPMKPTKRKDIPTMLDDSFWAEATLIRNKLLTYRFNNLYALPTQGKEERLNGVEPRLKQTLLPLLYVIQDKSMEDELINYALDFQEQIFSDRSFELEALIAEKLVNLFDNNDKVGVKDVWESINKELDDKEKITTKAVGLRVRGFGFKTKRIQGVYQIEYSQPVISYLKERYSLTTVQEESPQNPPSPPLDSASEVDIVDMGDNGQMTLEKEGV